MRKNIQKRELEIRTFLEDLINNLGIVFYFYDNKKNSFTPKYNDKNLLMKEYVKICMILFDKNINYELTDKYHVKILSLDS